MDNASFPQYNHKAKAQNIQIITRSGVVLQKCQLLVLEKAISISSNSPAVSFFETKVLNRHTGLFFPLHYSVKSTGASLGQAISLNTNTNPASLR